MNKLLVLAGAFLLTANGMEGSSQSYEEVYSWINLDFDWKSASMREEYVRTNRFIPDRNAPSGLKVYDGEAYVVVPRWYNGVPSSLNKVVTKIDGTHVMQPFPSWEMQTIGDCNAFQFVQAIEIDPNTGWMWIVDTGRSAVFDQTGAQNSCPAKIVIYSIDKKKEIRRHTFPDSVAGRQDNYLDDIVLDVVDGKVRYAYITDTGTPGLVVYDFDSDASYRFEDDATMSNEPNTPIQVGDESVDLEVPINGIAMSPDFKYVYFTAVSGLTMYQVPTKALRNPGTNISREIRSVGKRPTPSDGMVYSRENLYFGGLNDATIYRWNVPRDVKNAPMMSEGKVTMDTVTAILKNSTTMSWVDTFAIDEDGYLWFTSPNNGRVFLDKLSTTQTNFRILKTYIGEPSYLSKKQNVHSAARRSYWSRPWDFVILFFLLHRVLH